MSNTIVFIFEGAKTESLIFNNIKKIFFNDEKKKIKFVTFEAEIYQLWNNVKDDDFIDIIEELRFRNKENETKLLNISRDDVSEIYLFFDYDRHSRTESEKHDQNLNDMIEYFNNETENGKLYLSYPMVEALKDCKKDIKNCTDNCYINFNESKNYKHIVGKRSDFLNISKYDLSTWILLISFNVNKAHCLIYNKNELNEYAQYQSLTQQIILKKQTNNNLFKTIKVLITLSAFPFFIIDYFGKNLFSEIISKSIDKYCSFLCFKKK